jgi:hypothetical protein
MYSNSTLYAANIVAHVIYFTEADQLDPQYYWKSAETFKAKHPKDHQISL